MERDLGFIGVGRMGGPMASRLLDAGFSLTVFDTDAQRLDPLINKGAKSAESPAEVASAAEIVIASLPDPDAVKAVALGPQGIIEGRSVRIWVDTSTCGSSCARHVASGLAKKGICAADSPVSGGVQGAIQGALAVMLSCADQVFERVEPVLKHLGKVFRVGTQPGNGQTLKLLNNLLSATAMAVTSEVVVAGVKAGLDPSIMVDVINAGSGRNSATLEKFPRFVIPRSFNMGFTLELLSKDLRLCLQEADALGTPMVLGSVVRQIVAIAMAAEGEGGDMTEIVKPLERWAGVTVGATAGS